MLPVVLSTLVSTPVSTNRERARQWQRYPAALWVARAGRPVLTCRYSYTPAAIGPRKVRGRLVHFGRVADEQEAK